MNDALKRTPEEICRSKKVYRSKSVAREFGRAALQYRDTPLWVYQCAVCNRWHLTSQPQPAPSSAVTYERKK